MSFGILCQQKLFPAIRLFHWELNVKKPCSSFVGLDDEQLPDDGINGVYGSFPQWARDSLYYYFSDWSYVTKQGSLVKRIRKHLRNQVTLEGFTSSYGVTENAFAELSPDIWGSIGSIIGEYQNAKIQYEFVNRMDWEHGDFADGGSCYLTASGCRRYMPANLHRLGAHFIRFYDSDDKGIGRAILMPYYEGKECVIINAYGVSLLKTARILSLITGLEYRRVTVHNYGDWNKELYINQGVGYVVGENVCRDYAESGDDVIDFEKDIEVLQCYGCDRYVNDAEEIVEVNGHDYCRECVNLCEDCEEYTRSDLVTVHDSDGAREVCEDCRDASYHQCPCCGNYVED